MADGDNEYRFHIHTFTPETISMKRLAEYMGDLANLLGHPHSVHFVRIDAGSLAVVHRVDTADIPKVRQRLEDIGRDPARAASDVLSAYNAINARLESDNTRAEIFADENVIEFPGKTIAAPEKVIIGPITQRDTIIGIPILIGGKRDLVSVNVETESGIVPCHAKRNVARRLGKYLFEDVIKAVGDAKWSRTEEEGWTIEDFVIDDFDRPEADDLERSVELIRRVTSGRWNTDDPVEEMLRMRRDD